MGVLRVVYSEAEGVPGSPSDYFDSIDDNSMGFRIGTDDLIRSPKFARAKDAILVLRELNRRGIITIDDFYEVSESEYADVIACSLQW